MRPVVLAAALVAAAGLVALAAPASSVVYCNVGPLDPDSDYTGCGRNTLILVGIQCPDGEDVCFLEEQE